MDAIYRRVPRRDVGAFLLHLAADLAAYRAGDLPLARLTWKYEPEFNSHQNALYKRKDKARVHDSIRPYPDFMELVVMKIGPRLPGTELDRLNNHMRIYQPGFLAWHTRKQQAMNRHTNIRYTLTDTDTGEDFETTISGWMEDRRRPRNLTEKALRKRLERKADPQMAFFAPKGARMSRSNGEQRRSRQSVVAQCYEVYISARFEHFPTADTKLTDKERSHLQRFVADWPGHAPSSLRYIVEHWAAVRAHAERTANLRFPDLPWPWHLANNVAVLREAVAYLRNQEQHQRERDMEAELERQEREAEAREAEQRLAHFSEVWKPDILSRIREHYRGTHLEQQANDAPESMVLSDISEFHPMYESHNPLRALFRDLKGQSPSTEQWERFASEDLRQHPEPEPIRLRLVRG